jgi:hypothetical protein
MKKHSSRYFLAVFTVLALFTGVFSFPGCKEEEDKPAPQIPPESTFVVDFSDYPDADTTSYRDMDTYKNWWWAANNVAAWNTFIALSMAVPIASFREAFNHEAVYDPDSDSWTWSYNFWLANVGYMASLHASLVTEGVKWEMYISKDGAYSDFLWYMGVSGTDVTEGYWIIYRNPLDPAELVEITWHRDPAAGTGDIKYMNVEPGGSENGGYIHYGTTSLTPYNAFYNIYNKGKDNLTEISWDRTTKAGQVKDPFHFGDDAWHCWNELLQDITCP